MSRGRRWWLAVGLALQIGMASADQSASTSPLVEQGRYLAIAGNCASCHTQPGGAAFAGGVAFHTQFGTIYSTNITPDRATGIGAWTQTQFRRAMREGIDAEGEHLYPAFPYTSFTQLSDADVDALFAYLKTVPAKNAPARDNEMSFPFGWRALMSVWNALFFEPKRFAHDAQRSQAWNRGAYLVNALGHCGACHTPRNFLGAERQPLALTGGTYLDKVPGGEVREWSAVNLTSAGSGLKAWSVADTVKYLKTGINAYASTFGPMNDVVMHSTRHLTDSDVRSIAEYLASLPANEQAASQDADADTLSEGEALYALHCGTCHLPTGKGSIDTGPALAGNPVVQSHDPVSLLNVILYGPELPTPPPEVKWTHMDAYRNTLSDQEIAAIATYLRNSWGHARGAVPAEQVAKQR